MKTCRRCWTAKSGAEFPSMPKCRDGLSSWCRECHNTYARQYAREHKARYQASYRARRTAPTLWVDDPAEQRRAEQEQRRLARTARRAADKLARLIGQACPVRYGTCRACDGPFVIRPREVTRLYCTQGCGQRARLAPYVSPATEKECLECGRRYLGKPGRRFCKAFCATKYHASNYRHMKRSAARVGDRISATLVFERDGWICGICGLRVDPSMPSNSRLGPTLDHIVPLARGGTHTLENVQLAHLVCNSRKSAKVA